MLNLEIEGGYQLPGSSEVVWIGSAVVQFAMPVPDPQMMSELPVVPGTVLSVKLTPIDEHKAHFFWKRWNGRQYSDIGPGHCEYRVSESDIGSYICCETYFTDSMDHFTRVVMVESHSAVVSADGISIDGEGTCGSVIEAISKSNVVWERRKGKNKWIEIGSKPKYRLNADDVSRLVRVRNASGKTAEIGPIEYMGDLFEKIRGLVDSGTFSFKGKDVDGIYWNVEVTKRFVGIKSKVMEMKIPLGDFEVKAKIGSERKLIMSGRGFTPTTVYPQIPEMEDDVGQTRDICILAVKLQKRKFVQDRLHRKK
jgi:hypothetical protein